MTEPTVTQKFWSLVNTNGPVPEYRPELGPCWIWLGAMDREYGRFSTNGKGYRAHRFAYELLKGPIPKGKVTDHLCRVRCCVNPGHIEPVTNKENLLRGVSFSAVNARKTHCPKGHPFDERNTFHCRERRHCRACRREADDIRRHNEQREKRLRANNAAR